MRSVAVASLSSLLIATALIMVTMFTPSISPIASQADWDGDGYDNRIDLFPQNPNEWTDSDEDGIGDNSDALPNDPYEIMDSDGDGVGDNADFCDSGNGGITISIDVFEFEGYAGGYNRWKNEPDAWFEIKVDTDGDGIFDLTRQSDIFNACSSLEDFFNITLDLDDSLSLLRFTVLAYDVWETSENRVTDYEVFDYLPEGGSKAAVHEVELPYSGTWLSSGAGDSDTPDCTLGYSLDTVAL